ncbi:mitotic checkpoint regulator, MAD2B-interacting-domain-containing protein [Tricladium varicosporioides]|nr:mitotic checkpoint regulator, MAD2B-interacting-domain-containing protein [Hymenoscyphus varicosporioides]
MGLVDYSDSDASDVEEVKTTSAASTTSKPTFQKVVDRSNPGKIKVSLPQTSLKDETTTVEPPTKRVKTGRGAFSGFNSFLPAPKRTGQNTNATLGGGNVARNGLGAGVNLKTGATPGFSREAEPEREYIDENDTPEGKETGNGLDLPPPKAQPAVDSKTGEVKLVGKPLMFRPLSVARKPMKKKVASIASGITSTSTPSTPSTPAPAVQKATPKAKVSLFSLSEEPTNIFATPKTAEYEPMMDTPEDVSQSDSYDPYGLEPTYEEYTPNTSHIAPPAVPTPPVSQSLDYIAGDLNLSAAERRQLFGRQKGGRGLQSATKVINFNTDQEYLHNEELRAAGEQVVHNPVRSIAPGKHSLKQLVNAAQSQKEALEESFAKGKSNRAEASSRYGW